MATNLKSTVVNSLTFAIWSFKTTVYTTTMMFDPFQMCNAELLLFSCKVWFMTESHQIAKVTALSGAGNVWSGRGHVINQRKNLKQIEIGVERANVKPFGSSSLHSSHHKGVLDHRNEVGRTPRAEGKGQSLSSLGRGDHRGDHS